MSSPSDQSLYNLTSSLPRILKHWIQATNDLFTLPEYSNSLVRLLIIIYRNGHKLQQKELARLAGVNAAAMVRIVDQGVAAGLLKRCAVPGDRRGNYISLETKGEELVKRVEKALAELRKDILGDFSEEDILTTLKVLSCIEQGALEYHKKHQDS